MIGIFGGTFDPVHNGHLRVALDALELLDLERVRFVPGALPPHRQAPGVSATDRSTMVSLAIAETDGFLLDERELFRDEPSWTIHTLESMREDMPDESLCLLLGEDAFCGLTSWKRWEELTDHAHLVVLQRPGHELELCTELEDWLAERRVQDREALAGARAGKVMTLAVTQLEISATDIRNRVAEGRSLRYLVPRDVQEYIEERGFYRP